MSLPEEPVILLSYVNTKLRDIYPSLKEFCVSEDVDMEMISRKLKEIAYEYDAEVNQFV